MDGFSFQCGDADWTVHSVARSILDPIIGLAIYMIDTYTVSWMEESLLCGQHGCLKKQSTVLAESVILQAKSLHNDAGVNAFRIQMEVAGQNHAWRGRENEGDVQGWIDIHPKELDGPTLIPLPPNGRHDPGRVPGGRQSLGVDDRPAWGGTERIHSAQLQWKLDDEPLYRESTLKLKRIDVETVQSVLSHKERTEVVRFDELERLHLAKCVERGTGASKASEPRLVPGEQDEEERFFCELARVFHDREHAMLLVIRAGFPRARIPNFTTALWFWTKVVEETYNGVLMGGVLPLVDEAARMYPSNPVFAQHCRIISGRR